MFSIFFKTPVIAVTRLPDVVSSSIAGQSDQREYSYRPTIKLVGILVVALMCGTTMPAAAQTPPTVDLVSAIPFGIPGNGESELDLPDEAKMIVSADGRMVVFTSNATNLTGGPDINNDSDVFVRDLKTGTTTLVSRRRVGFGTGNGKSFDPSISADGSRVAFTSNATNLTLPSGLDGVRQVYVRNLSTGQTTLVSHTPTGQPGDDNSERPRISADGSTIAFNSQADNLTDNDVIGTDPNVFVSRIDEDSVRLVSVTPAGRTGNRGSAFPALSANGRFIAFESLASDLTGFGDTNGDLDVYLRDVEQGTTIAVSRRVGDTSELFDMANGRSEDPVISADGNLVAFTSDANNLTNDPDIQGTRDVYAFNRSNDSQTLVSIGQGGVAGDGASKFSEISADGSTIAFVSAATNLTSNAKNGDDDDVFVWDVATGTTTLVSAHQTFVSGNLDSDSPRLSANGQWVVFQSQTNLTGGSDANGSDEDVFLHDLTTSETVVISTTPTGDTGNDRSTRPEISANGHTVVFESRATNLTGGVDLNGQSDVFAVR